MVAIILTYNNAETIEASLGSVIRQVDHVFVVDNASHDGTLEKVERVSNVLTIRRDRNYGIGSRNLAIKMAMDLYDPDYYMVMDPDATFSEDAVQKMIARLDGKPGIVAVRMDKNPRYPLKHDTLFYTFTFFSREVMRYVGGYEPAFFAYYEDPYIGTKAMRAGFPVYNEPFLTMSHEQMHSTRQIRGLRSYMRMRNWFLYNRLTTSRLRTFLLHPFRASRNLAAAVQLGEFQFSCLGYISGMLMLLSKGKHDAVKRIAECLMGYKLCLQ